MSQVPPDQYARKRTTYSILIREDLPHVEDAARDVRDRLAAKSDARGAVVPGAPDVELDVLAVGFVFEGDGGFVGEY